MRDESAIRYTGKSVVANGMTQTLTALLTDPDGGEPLAGRLVTFTIGSLSATAAKPSIENETRIPLQLWIEPNAGILRSECGNHPTLQTTAAVAN